MSEIELTESKRLITETSKLSEIPKGQKYVFSFPPSVENAFRKFDDSIISCLQTFHPKKEGIINKIIGYPLQGLSLIFTCKDKIVIKSSLSLKTDPLFAFFCRL